MTSSKDKTRYFDDGFAPEEQLPRRFSVDFIPIGNDQVRVVSSENCQLGDVINDNSNDEDFYRYHDIFHFSFATILGWSPCTRSIMKRKRKSDVVIDKVEDGARATITEEAISLIIFNEAKRKNYFSDKRTISRTTLRIIKEMTDTFEVRVRSTKDWENAIKKAYQLFRLLVQNRGGRVEFNLSSGEMQYKMIGAGCI